MKKDRLLEEARTAMQRYRLTLSPGIYLFASEIQRGKMTGRIIEDRSDYPPHYFDSAEVSVILGFCPLGLVPKSLKGAPESWLSDYPMLPGLEKLAEAPETFLEQLKRHVEQRMQLMKQGYPVTPAGRGPTEETAATPKGPLTP